MFNVFPTPQVHFPAVELMGLMADGNRIKICPEPGFSRCFKIQEFTFVKPIPEFILPEAFSNFHTLIQVRGYTCSHNDTV
jgi:hypothetical protein